MQGLFFLFSRLYNRSHHYIKNGFHRHKSFLLNISRKYSFIYSLSIILTRSRPPSSVGRDFSTGHVGSVGDFVVVLMCVTPVMGLRPRNHVRDDGNMVHGMLRHNAATVGCLLEEIVGSGMFVACSGMFGLLFWYLGFIFIVMIF